MKPGPSVPGPCGTNGAPKTHTANILGWVMVRKTVDMCILPFLGPRNTQGPSPALQTLPCAFKHWQPLQAQIRHPGTNHAPGLTPSIPLMPASTVLGHVPEAASRALNNSGKRNGIMNLLTTQCGLGTYISRNTDSPGRLSRRETYRCQETVASARLVGFKPDSVETLLGSRWLPLPGASLGAKAARLELRGRAEVEPKKLGRKSWPGDQ